MDHWKQLAEELGAEIPPEEPTQVTPGDGEGGDTSRFEAGVSVEPPVAPAAKAPLPPRPSPPRRTASDWSRLAEELGIEVPPEPEPEPAPLGEPVAAVEEKAASRLDELAPRRTLEAESEPRREETRRRPDERDREEDRVGRRRRRRRRRPADDAERRPLEPAAKSDSLLDDEDEDLDFGDEDLMLPEAEPGEFDEAEEFGEEMESPDSAAVEVPDRPPEDESGRGRGKRRRRRKSAASRRQTPLSATEESAPDHLGGTAPSVSQRSVPESFEDELDVDDAEFEDEEAEHHADKALHRAIPSWYEAVNLVVSANLELRAKNPDRKGSGRPRGGQDRRGRDRNRPNS